MSEALSFEGAFYVSCVPPNKPFSMLTRASQTNCTFWEFPENCELLLSCPGDRGIPQIRRVEDMLAGIPGTTDATNKLRPEGTFSLCSGQMFLRASAERRSPVLSFLPARAHHFTQ